MVESVPKNVGDLVSEEEKKKLSESARTTTLDTLYDLDAYARALRAAGKTSEELVSDFAKQRNLDITVEDVRSIEIAISQSRVAQVEGEELLVGGCCCCLACCCCCGTGNTFNK